ncbi:hypothetical protein [Streptomyces sp. NPDC094472]|uniref:hypothetical protein n=1 Tax=unclassified Streptomyces TaxID=2593676 RepID=UPI0033169893
MDAMRVNWRMPGRLPDGNEQNLQQSCVDTAARFGQELGYQVTLVRDAIGAFDSIGRS